MSLPRYLYCFLVEQAFRKILTNVRNDHTCTLCKNSPRSRNFNSDLVLYSRNNGAVSVKRSASSGSWQKDLRLKEAMSYVVEHAWNIYHELLNPSVTIQADLYI